MWRHLGILSCRDCDERFTCLDLKGHEQKGHVEIDLRKTRKEKFICDFCQKEFCNKQTITVHLKLHLNPDLFKCNHCLKRFSTADHLRRHKMFKQTPDIFKCKICPRKFHTSYNQNYYCNFSKKGPRSKCYI